MVAALGSRACGLAGLVICVRFGRVGKLRSVQVLRGVAAVGVVLFHYGSIEIGRAGVDLFFVISGFIMANVIPGKTVFEFVRARFFRIFPPYFAATVLVLVTGQAVLTPARLFDSALLIPSGDFYLPQAWTLVFEMIFYLGCAAFMLTGKWAFALLPLAWIFERLAHSGYTGIAATPLFLEFFLGLFVARLPPRFGWASIALAFAAVFVLHSVDIDRLLKFGIPAAFLLHGCICLERHFAGWAVPALIGDASYSIYLTHWTFLALIPGRLWLLNAYFATMLGLAFYLAIERPLVSFFSGRLALGRYRLVGMPARQKRR